MYQRTVLPNGMRIVTEHIPHVRSVTIGLWIETGSRDENPSQLGYSHFIEHMTFKGSKKYSAREIAEKIDACGGQLNAFTGKEYTCYYARILDEHLPLIADILKEMLMFPELSVADLEKERSVILEEIKMYEDTPDELVHDLLCESIWPNHALGRSILGTRESILQAKREDLLHFLSEYYTSDRLIIAAAGNVDHHTLVEIGQGLNGFNQSVPASEQGKPRLALNQCITKAKDIEQTHLCLGGPAICRFDYRKYTLHLLDTIMGGGMSSRLFQELREERGLVYATYSYHSSYRDTGNYGIYAGCSPEYVGRVIEIIEEQLISLTQAPILQQELERAKGQLKGNLMLSLESTTNRMCKLAKSEMNYGQICTTDEILTAITRVTVEQIYELASEIYQPSNWSITCVGPTAGVMADAVTM